jgi:hypothetical protein
MTAMIVAASQQNLTKKLKHRQVQSDTPQTTQSNKSLKERYEKIFLTIKCFICLKLSIKNIQDKQSDKRFLDKFRPIEYNLI